MKVIAIVGSPRANSNSGILAQEVLKSAEAEGAETKIFYANEMNMVGCQGCSACKYETDHCVQKDDMTHIYDELNTSDAVVFATPVYMFGMTGQLKLVLDRLFSYLTSDFLSRMPKGKKLGLIFTQGMPDAEVYSDYFDSVGDILHRLGFNKPEEIIVGAGLGAPGLAAKEEALLESARSLGKRLAT
ncbi:MAG: flavodoxin family protein [Candidatus Coatesbacteria bacterium]|nr:flavodoxin family protein [Candidatus Coatesbacteria bacterium]